MIATTDNTIWNYCCDGWLQEIFKTPTIIANFLKKLLATLLLPRVYNKYQLQMQIKNRPLCQYWFFPEIVNLISSIFVIKCINKRVSLYSISCYIVTTSYQLVFLLWQVVALDLTTLAKPSHTFLAHRNAYVEKIPACWADPRFGFLL